MERREVRELIQEELSKARPDELRIREISQEEVVQAIKVLRETSPLPPNERPPFEVLIERAAHLREIAEGVDALLVAAKRDPALANLIQEMIPHSSLLS